MQKSVAFNGMCKAVDASLGVPGLPQSATGQSSLFSGKNTPSRFGGHLAAFPDKKLRAFVFKNNILKYFQERQLRSVFFNAYPLGSRILNDKKMFGLNPDGSFIGEKADDLSHKISVTTVMALSIQQEFTGLEQICAGNTVYQDITNEQLLAKSPNIPVRSAAQSGKIIAQGAKNTDLLLFEFFHSDMAGHHRNMNECTKDISLLSEFTETIVSLSDLSRTTIIVSSDHGNIEDLRTGLHTENPVPLIVWGKHRDRIITADSIAEITPAVMSSVGNSSE